MGNSSWNGRKYNDPINFDTATFLSLPCLSHHSAAVILVQTDWDDNIFFIYLMILMSIIYFRMKWRALFLDQAKHSSFTFYFDTMLLFIACKLKRQRQIKQPLHLRSQTQMHFVAKLNATICEHLISHQNKNFRSIKKLFLL